MIMVTWVVLGGAEAETRPRRRELRGAKSEALREDSIQEEKVK